MLYLGLPPDFRGITTSEAGLCGGRRFRPLFAHSAHVANRVRISIGSESSELALVDGVVERVSSALGLAVWLPLKFVDLHAERFEFRSSKCPDFGLARAD